MTICFMKAIAAVFMLLDHINKVFRLSVHLFDFVGRIAFPLFAFSFVEGCRKTQNTKARLLRLTGFAFLAEPCYNFAVDIRNWIRVKQGTETVCLFAAGKFRNVIFTMLIAYLAILLGKKFRWIPKILLFAAAMFLAEMLHTDYGAWGVLLVVSLYACKDRKWSVLVTFLWCTLFYLGYASWNGFSLMWLGDCASPFYIWQWIFACMSIPCIWFYNGELGRKWKVGFYLFYPLHLLLLAVLRECIYL